MPSELHTKAADPANGCSRLPPSTFKMAVCQFKIGTEKKQNLDRAREFIHRAAGSGARLVALPEMFICPYVARLFPNYAESCAGGDSFLMLARAAREENIFLVGGSVPERDGEQVFNASFIFDPLGNLIAHHRKVHLFDVDLPGGLSFRESATLSPGSTATVVATPLCTIGVAICFDVRFPALFREMTLKGAQVVVIPAAFNMITGPAHWELLLRARAVDNQVYVVGAAPARDPGADYVAFGHSMVVSPWAEIIARAGPEEAVIVADIDLERLARVRRELPLGKRC
ncbi:MAG: carbon-nitrogen hydrolase family protein [Ammonifex sp.]|nr:MAG: carbon-nitrogen hydrolase family protein [Ammonifex sp.]